MIRFTACRRALTAAAALIASSASSASSASAAAAASAAWPASPQDPPVQPRPAEVEPAPSQGLSFDVLDNGLRVRVDPVRGATHVGLVLGVPCGTWHDPEGRTGLARVIEQQLRARLPASSPARPSGVTAIGPGTLLAVTAPHAEWRERLGDLQRLLAGAVECDDDAVLEARGKALLRADDELQELPGPLLRDRARRALWAGGPRARPAAGLPGEIRALLPQTVRERLRRAFEPSRAFLIVLGGVDAAEATAALRETVGAVEPRAAPAIPISDHQAGPEPVERSAHPRVDAPFLTVATPAPAWGDADFVPFMLAAQVARARAFRTFRNYRGGELSAEFPFAVYDPLAAASVLTINRRGRDGDSIESVRAEIESLLGGLRVGGPTFSEVGSAVRSLNNMLQLPPFPDAEVRRLAQSAVWLHNRAGTMGFFALRGWPEDLGAAIGKVPVHRVQELMRRMLAPDRLRWFALEPGS